MGKAKSKSKTELVKKCTCDHPFRCDCGNRPERPSKGHKWDPTTQQWGGKGHKQKGATLQAASIGQADKVTNVGGVAIKQWQKLPSDLLKELCRKHAMGMPHYRRMEKAKSGLEYRYKLIVPSGKKGTSDHDVILSPSLAVSNDEQAKEEAALLGLLYVFPKLPHERTLPEPYRSTYLEAWKKTQTNRSSSSAPSSTSSSTTPIPTPTPPTDAPQGSKVQDVNVVAHGSAKANTQLTATLPQSRNNTSQSMSGPLLTKAQIREAKLMHQREVQARIRKHEAFRNANKPMEVFMCASMRRRMERLLSGDSVGADIPDDEDYQETVDVDEGDVVQSYVMQRLVHEGFTPLQARKGYRSISDSINLSNNNPDQLMDKAYEETLQYLCIHLSEDQLPIGFDPRGGTLDVIRPVKLSNTDLIGERSATETETISGNAKECYDPATVHFANQFGLLPKEASIILSHEVPVQSTPSSIISSSKELMQRWKLWSTLCSATSLPIERSCFMDASTAALKEDNIERNKEAASNELEALEAIFDGQDFSTTKLNDTTTSVSIGGLLYGEAKLCLEVIYSDGHYPDLLPMIFVTPNDSSKFCKGGQLHFELLQFLRALEPGQEVLFELFGHTQELLQKFDGIKDTNVLLHSLTLTDKESSSSSNSIVASIDERSNYRNESSIPRQCVKPPRRPREKISFWNTSPNKTPATEPFPKLSVLLEKARESLPAAKARSEFLSLLEQANKGGRVLLVTGETGCGKTTQIPQFILEDKPSDAKIVVAQPRRLAATGVASRVAIERGESRAGIGSVGYSVRGDSANCGSTRLMFCTTGVLLRQLQSQGALENITHIVIDEVHERHLDSDVLLAILKQVLPENPHLNVVLMSATMEADKFASYFGKNTPRMHIPGFTHPVEDFMLEDVLQITGYVPPKNRGVRKDGNGRYQIQASFIDGDTMDLNDDGVTPSEVEDNHGLSSAVISLEERLDRMDPNNIDYDLLALLIKSLLKTKSDDGSILVFLPGVGEIERAERAINQMNIHNIQVLPLHGGLQPEKQQQVFLPAPMGLTKIILSTNVAETSITIPDCTMVIDTAKEKQSSFDPVNRMPLLLERFASQDSLRQRRGRAGRVRPGVCYKLISKKQYAKISAHGTPEIKRCALEQTILSLLFLGLEDGSGDFLRSMIDPPTQESIDSALMCLEQLSAIERKDDPTTPTLCPLGRHLAGIPAPPTVAKLLVMGSLLGCRSMALAIAAGMSVGRSPFMRVEFPRKRNDDPLGDDKRAANEQILEARKALFKTVGNSEHALLGKTYLLWDEAKGTERRKFCDRLGLAFNSMREMKQLVQQLDNSLSSLGFVESTYSNMCNDSWRVVRAVLVSALAPSQVIRVQRPTTKYTETVEGAVEKDGKAQDLKFFIRGDGSTKEQKEERVFFHPGCNMFSVGSYSCPWLVYHKMVRTSKAFIHDATEASAYALLLFGGTMDVQASRGLVVLDNRIVLSANARIGSLMGGLRKKIDQLLENKVANPSIEIADTDEMKLVVDLLKYDGLGK